jgi:hypothetical protein
MLIWGVLTASEVPPRSGRADHAGVIAWRRRRGTHKGVQLSLSMALLGLSVACSGRERVNTNCQWVHDTAFQIDLTDRTHQTHLRHDADLMEDLAIRYADAHAGRVGRPQWPEARDACMTKLFAVIGNHHRVSEGQIRQWIGRRNLTFDLAVFVSFLGWWFFVSRALTRRIFNAWSFRGALAMFAAATLTPIVGEVGGAAGTFWAVAWEIVRVGNSHMSHRATRVPWPYYVPSLILAAWVVCSFVARREYQAVARRAALMDLDDPSARSRVLLR